MVLKTRFLLLLIAIVAVLNLFVYVNLREKLNELNNTKSILTDNIQIDDHFNVNRQIQYDVLRKEALRARIQPELANASQNFGEAILQLDSITEQRHALPAIEFFNERIKVSPSIQQRLWDSHERLSRGWRDEIMREREAYKFYIAVRKERRKKYHDFLSQMQNVPNETHKTFRFPLTLIDTTQEILISAVKQGDSIHWSENFSLIPNYLEKVDFFLDACRMDETTYALDQLNNAFPQKGKVRVYAIIYDLSNITSAELRTISNCLKMAYGKFNYPGRLFLYE